MSPSAVARTLRPSVGLALLHGTVLGAGTATILIALLTLASLGAQLVGEGAPRVSPDLSRRPTTVDGSRTELEVASASLRVPAARRSHIARRSSATKRIDPTTILDAGR